MANPVTEELLNLNDRLLRCIAEADWGTYQELCDSSLTAFEPESQGQLVEGLAFHKFYFELGGVKGSHLTTMCAPHVRLMGDVAVIAYIRLNQRLGSNREPVTTAMQETRVWQRHGGKWKHVHFHRSPLQASVA
jgi:calcium/calmodulin-dependent protein kinase (CaM kinase) II